MMIQFVLVCSVFVQVITVLIAIRLIVVTERRLAWGVISAGLAVMAARRIVNLWRALSGDSSVGLDPANEFLGFVISLFMLVGVAGMAPLFSAIRKAEHALQETSHDLLAIIQTSPQAIIALDTGGRVTLWNPAAERIFGWRKDEVLDRPNPIVPPEVLDEVQAIRARVGAGETVTYDEAVRWRKDESRIQVAFSAAPLRDATNANRGILLIFADTTEYRKVAEALRQNEERFSRVLSASSIGISVTNLDDGTFVEVNDAFLSLYGRSREEVIGRTSLELKMWVDPEHRHRMARLVGQQGRVQDFETQIRLKSGEIRQASFSAEIINVRKERCILGLTRDITDRKRADEELIKLRKAVNASGEVIFMTDRNGVFTFVNPAFTDLYGYDATEVIGKTTPRILKGDTMNTQGYGQFWEKLLRKERFRGEFMNRTKGGEPVMVEASVNPILDDTDSIIGFLAIQENMLVRKQMEEALRQARDFAEHVIETANVIFLQLDVEGRVLKINSAAEEITGYTSADVEGKSWFESLVPRERYPRVWEEFLRLTSKGEEAHIFENPILTRSGDERQILWKNHVMRDGKKVIGTISFGIDVTERKKAEGALKESEERLLVALDAARMYTWDWNVKTGRLVRSGYFGEVFGPAVGATESTYAEFLSVVHPHDRGRVEGAVNLALEGKALYHADFRIVQPSGDVRWLETQGQAYRDESGRVDRIIGVTRDITERKVSDERRTSLEAQLQQAQKLESLGTLASGIAHDFNNILAIIVGHSSLLERIRMDPEKFAQSLDALQQASQRGASLVRQLLTFARKTESVLELVLLNDIIGEIAKLLRETFPRNITLVTDLAPDLLPILADATQIHQVLLNLCVNARDAMPNGGTLRIKSSTIDSGLLVSRVPKVIVGQYLVVTVADTGTGMDEETKKRIFEPFFTTKGPGKGTGLGLALVYSIVENHHGFVDVETEPGKGTIFSIFLPVPEERTGQPEAPKLALQDAPGGNETILLIEDEEMLQELVKAVLISKGYTVLTAADGEEGVSIFASNRSAIGVIVTDLGLPVFGGKEVFRRIRALDPAAKFIFASGFIEPAEKLDLYSSGARHFIQKPYLPSEVLQAIRDVLDADPGA